MDQRSPANSLLEHGWFFGNSLANKPRSTSKMVRCFSDPWPCSSTKDEDLVSPPQSQPNSRMSNLLRTPSLPPCWGREKEYSQEEEGDEEEDEPRMDDLIRQAMPLPVPSTHRRLNRAPSLPPCRGKEGSSMAPSIQNGPSGVGRLTRRASIDSSIILPAKYTSKATKQSSSNSKNRPHRSQNEPTKDDTRSQNLNKIRSQKSRLTDLDVEELEGFKDSVLSFENKRVITPSVAQVLPALQRRASIDSSFNDNAKIRRPDLPEPWHRSSASSPLSAPPILKWDDQKAPSDEDMKAQLKFWARAVASNVLQEC